MRQFRITLPLLGCLAAGGCAVNGLGHIEENYAGLSSEEIRIGDKASAVAQAARPIIHDETVSAYMAEIKGTLLANTRFAQVPGQIYLAQDAAVYAYSLPNGDIFISTGLLSLAQNDSELAAILGHELGHILLGHFPKGREQQSKLDNTLGPAGTPSSKGLNSSFASVLRFGNSREREQEADRFMLQILERSEYDPCGAHAIFTKMLALQQQFDPAASQTRLFDTHPATPERIAQIDDRISMRGCSRHPSVPSERYLTDVVKRVGAL